MYRRQSLGIFDRLKKKYLEHLRSSGIAPIGAHCTIVKFISDSPKLYNTHIVSAKNSGKQILVYKFSFIHTQNVASFHLGVARYWRRVGVRL
jgi:hypothetical protein